MREENIRPKWLDIARRLQAFAPSGGFSVLSIRVVVDSCGNPVLWTEPTKTKIEPSRTDRDTILSLLTDTNA